MYDKIPRSNLLHVLLNELGICESNLKLLMRMYREIEASIYINGEYSEPFHMHEGVC